jgi:hypothetical protein
MHDCAGAAICRQLIHATQMSIVLTPLEQVLRMYGARWMPFTLAQVYSISQAAEDGIWMRGSLAISMSHESKR